MNPISLLVVRKPTNSLPAVQELQQQCLQTAARYPVRPNLGT